MDEEVKVSQLPETTSINNSDLIMIVQNGHNKKIQKEKITEENYTTAEKAKLANQPTWIKVGEI